MPRPGRHLKGLSCPELETRIVHLEDRPPLQDVEELPCARVKMATLTISRWNSLLDNTQLSAIEQMPTLAGSTPLISLSRTDIDNSQQVPLPVAG